MTISRPEYLWREWLLGEGHFEGARQSPARRLETGAPAHIPPEWWHRLEAFLARRSDHTEHGRETRNPPASTKPATKGQLSPHFNVREFDCHDGRRVPAVAVPALTRLCHSLLEPMRSKFGSVHVLSGYRPKDYNAHIGGAKFSQHIYELTPECVAADLVFATGTPALWAMYADKLGAGGVGRYDHSGFVHVDNRPGRARWTG